MTTPQQQPAAHDAWSPTPSPAQPLYGPPGYAPAPRWNVMSIVALVAAFFIPLAAVILGWVSVRQIGRTGEQGKPLAIAALVIGGLGCLGWILFWVAIIAGGGSFSYSVGG
jgi:peptidyl-prolyl cis-trans isomerase B (cyclophilin B)